MIGTPIHAFDPANPMPVQVGDFVSLGEERRGVVSWIDPEPAQEGVERLCRVRMFTGSEVPCMETDLKWDTPRFKVGEGLQVVMISGEHIVLTREPWRVVAIVPTVRGFEYMVRMDGAFESVRKSGSLLRKLPA